MVIIFASSSFLSPYFSQFISFIIPLSFFFFFGRLLQIILENRGGTNNDQFLSHLPLQFHVSMCIFFSFFHIISEKKILFLFPPPVSLIFRCLSPCHVILNKDKIFLSWENIYSLTTALLITIFIVSLMNVSLLFYSSSNWVFTSMSVCEI